MGRSVLKVSSGFSVAYDQEEANSMIFFYVLVVGTALFVCWAVGVHWIVWMFVALCVASMIFGFRKGMRDATAVRLAANEAQPMNNKDGRGSQIQV
jgi:hypothetical protein